eukprot:scaffold24432_cov29-Attheya_sp.AAC.1
MGKFSPIRKDPKELGKGVPVDCGPDWSPKTCRLAIEKGPHRSALAVEAMELVHEDVQYQVDAGFSRIVMWDDIKHNTPATHPGSILPSPPKVPTIQTKARSGHPSRAVNDTTTPLAREKPVNELGKVLLRIFDFMLEVPVGETINFSKIDLSDGFWRMVVEAEDAWNFAYVLPDPPGSPIRLVVPHALQMGWTQSPAFFCSATETTRD